LSTQKQPTRKLKEGIKGDAKFGIHLTLPAQIFVNVVVIFPILATLYLSFTDWTPLTGFGTKWYSAYKFWNWGVNYWYLVTDADFLLAMLRTLIIVVVVVPIEFALGFLLAFLFLDKFPFKKVLHDYPDADDDDPGRKRLYFLYAFCQQGAGKCYFFNHF